MSKQNNSKFSKATRMSMPCHHVCHGSVRLKPPEYNAKEWKEKKPEKMSLFLIQCM